MRGKIHINYMLEILNGRIYWGEFSELYWKRCQGSRPEREVVSGCIWFHKGSSSGFY